MSYHKTGLSILHGFFFNGGGGFQEQCLVGSHLMEDDIRYRRLATSNMEV